MTSFKPSTVCKRCSGWIHHVWKGEDVWGRCPRNLSERRICAQFANRELNRGRCVTDLGYRDPSSYLDKSHTGK